MQPRQQWLTKRNRPREKLLINLFSGILLRNSGFSNITFGAEDVGAHFGLPLGALNPGSAGWGPQESAYVAKKR